MKKLLLINLIFLLSFSACKKEKKGGDKTIISWNDIETSYVGSCSVPQGSEGVKDQNFYYSSGAFCMLNEKTIVLEGHAYSKQVRQLNLPENLTGSDATLAGEWFDPTNKLLSTGESQTDYYILGDMISVNDRIYFTKHQWYNASGKDFDSFGYRQKGSSFADGSTHGLWNANHELAHNLRIGGYLCHAPQKLKADGVTFLAGQEGLSGDARGRWGPNLFAVKFDDKKPKGAEMEVIPLIVHSNQKNAPENWWVANRVYSMVWIETATKRGVVALFTRGYGKTWYGEANGNNPPDPYGSYKGYHSTGKQLVAWIYNPDDLIKVYNKEIEPHEVKPVEEKVLIDLKPGNSKGMETYNSFIKKISSARMDTYGNRLIITQGGTDDLPVVYVVDL